MTLGTPTSPGVPADLVRNTLVLRFNDFDQLRETFARHAGQDCRRVMLEPVVGNMGLVAPEPGFLQTLRELTREDGSLLIFDEVMTGFRLAYGGAQERFGIKPDMTALGKIIGGGMPVGAYGGKGRRDGEGLSAGAGLSGGHALGKSARHGQRHRHARPTSGQVGVRSLGKTLRPVGGGTRQSSVRCRDSPHRARVSAA